MSIRNILIKATSQRIKTPSMPISAPPFLNTKFLYFCSSSTSHYPDIISVFQRYGVSHSKLPDFLRKSERLLNSTPSEIEKSLKILMSLKPSRDFLFLICSTCPGVLDLQFLEKWQKCSSQLEFITSRAMMNVLEVARKFGLSPKDALRFIDFLNSLEFSTDTISKILEAEPTIILSNKGAICSKIDLLLQIGIQRNDIDRLFSLFPGIVAFGVETRLKQLLVEFEDLGFSLSEVKREVLRNPAILGLENGELSQCLELLRSLKCRVAFKNKILRSGEFRAAYEVKLRVDCLKKYGLTYRDAFAMLSKEPRVISYEIHEVEKKIDFFLQKMKFDIQCMVEVPEYLGLNFDKQIFPRFKVIDYLRSNDGLGDPVTLRNFVKLSRLRFYNLYVKPYPELERIYGRFSAENQVESQYPVGLSKLFRPQNFMLLGQGVKNARSSADTSS